MIRGFWLIATLLVLGAATPLISANGDKVKVDFYFESLCPYCQQFI